MTSTQCAARVIFSKRHSGMGKRKSKRKRKRETNKIVSIVAMLSVSVFGF